MRFLMIPAVSLLLLVPFLAAAEPATIKRFEALARAEADRGSEVVHTFIEGEQVSVSEEATEGFRRVRLPDGSAGWIEEAALSFSSAPTNEAQAPESTVLETAEAPALAQGAAPQSYPEHAPTVAAQADEPTVRARIPLVFFDDLKALAEFTRDEPSVHRMARSLARRQTGATVVSYVSAGIAGGFLGLAAAIPECDRYGCRANTGMLLGAAASVLVGSLVSYSIQPKPHEFHALAAQWNATIDEAVVPSSGYPAANATPVD